MLKVGLGWIAGGKMVLSFISVAFRLAYSTYRILESTSMLVKVVISTAR